MGAHNDRASNLGGSKNDFEVSGHGKPGKAKTGIQKESIRMRPVAAGCAARANAIRLPSLRFWMSCTSVDA